jgi:sarcosine oxidase
MGWQTTLIERLSKLAVAERQVLASLQPRRPEWFGLARLPFFNLLVGEGRYHEFLVFAVPGSKFGRYHHLEQRVDLHTVDRRCYPEDEVILRQFAERYFPDGAGPAMVLNVRQFTNSPDEHFIIDLHPVLAASFSGHGYKFCSVVGEILADLSVRGPTDQDIRLFRLARFAETTTPAGA